MVVLAGSAPAAAMDTADVDAFVDAELPDAGAPGVAYTLVDGGDVATRFAGTLRQGGRPVSAETPFRLGSITKSFTALAVMQLVEGGSVELDAPVSTYLEGFAGGHSDDITVLQLLNHTSGFSTVQGNRLQGVEPTSVDRAAYATTLARLGPDHPPGTRWSYSNANYQVLGAVIEEVSGQSYSAYVTSHILEPLEMSGSSVDGAGSTPPVGHRPWFGGMRAFEGSPSHPLDAPAGGVTASAADMARYLAMWLAPGDDLLSADGKKQMMRPSSALSPHYGLGWSIDPHSGAVYHAGLVPGAEALAWLEPDRGRAVVVMVNGNSGFGFSDASYLIGGVAALGMGEPHDDDGSRWGPRGLYLSIALAPLLFGLLALVSWRGASTLRAKRASGAGRFSLWFPLVAMSGLAWFLLRRLPGFFGGSLETLQLYQPDFALCLMATAIAGVGWAVVRLVVAYGKPAT